MEYGKIAIFRVENKKTDKHPDYNGKITITEPMLAGEYEVSLYITTPKNGSKKYQAGKIREVYKKPVEKPQANNAYQKDELDSIADEYFPDDSGIPF